MLSSSPSMNKVVVTTKFATPPFEPTSRALGNEQGATAVHLCPLPKKPIKARATAANRCVNSVDIAPPPPTPAAAVSRPSSSRGINSQTPLLASSAPFSAATNLSRSSRRRLSAGKGCSESSPSLIMRASSSSPPPPVDRRCAFILASVVASTEPGAHHTSSRSTARPAESRCSPNPALGSSRGWRMSRQSTPLRRWMWHTAIGREACRARWRLDGRHQELFTLSCSAAMYCGMWSSRRTRCDARGFGEGGGGADRVEALVLFFQVPRQAASVTDGIFEAQASRQATPITTRQVGWYPEQASPLLLAYQYTKKEVADASRTAFTSALREEHVSGQVRDRKKARRASGIDDTVHSSFTRVYRVNTAGKRRASSFSPRIAQFQKTTYVHRLQLSGDGAVTCPPKLEDAPGRCSRYSSSASQYRPTKGFTSSSRASITPSSAADTPQSLNVKVAASIPPALGRRDLGGRRSSRRGRVICSAWSSTEQSGKQEAWDGIGASAQ